MKKIVKPSNRGTAIWVMFKGIKKRKLVSKRRLFRTKEEAEESLKIDLEAKMNRLIRLKGKEKEEENQINKILDNIFKSFGVIVKYLSRPCTIEEAWNLYYYLKENEGIRDIEIF